jgi:hypothetical protein
MVSAEVWDQTGGECDCLCVACLEVHLGRELQPEDFPPVILNDDHPTDSVRLRLRKGSGRAVEGLYLLAARAVVDLGVNADLAASTLGLESSTLSVCVNNARMMAEVAGAA